jgi:hypothetical protein
VAACVLWSAFSLPPARLVLDVPGSGDGTIAGSIHIHSNRSDGRGTPDEIAAAAARAGLRFIVLTDHGDGTRPLDPPAYRQGVLCLDGVEISTSGGHYLAVGLRRSPYPLAGEPRDVVDDVARLGGFGIVAHPDSPKDDLRWRDWSAGFDAIELLNPDSSWRTHLQQPGWRPKLRLLQGLATYPVRPSESMARLITESRETFTVWDALTRERRVTALAGVDAHARLALGSDDPGESRVSLPFPGYEALFETLSIRLRPERPLSGDAAADAALVIEALRRGRAYTSIDAIASPPLLEFTATHRGGTAEAGDEFVLDGPVTLRVRSNAPDAFMTLVWQGLQVFATEQSREFEVPAPALPAVYRVEIRAVDRPGSPPWILSNPIYVRSAEPDAPRSADPPSPESLALFDGRDLGGWRAETDRTSLAALEHAPGTTAGQMRLRFGLSTAADGQPFAAVTKSFTPAELEGYDRLTFEARAEGPMRISVQLRSAVSPSEDERWHRSVYVDAEERQYTLAFDDFRPIGVARSPLPALATVHSLAFVVDTTNTRAGTSGRLWIRDVRLER